MKGSSTENQSWPRTGDGHRGVTGSWSQPRLGGGHGSAAGAVKMQQVGKVPGCGLCLVTTFLFLVLELIPRLHRDKNQGLTPLPALSGTHGTRSPTLGAGGAWHRHTVVSPGLDGGTGDDNGEGLCQGHLGVIVTAGTHPGGLSAQGRAVPGGTLVAEPELVAQQDLVVAHSRTHLPSSPPAVCTIPGVHFPCHLAQSRPRRGPLG